MKQGCDDMGMTPEQAFQRALSLSKIYAKKTIEGEGAIKGKDGFSPTVVENPDNTNMDYRLDITTATGIYTTPNLMGPQGLKGEVGAQGIPGPQGRDGVQGQQGIQGIQGPKGDDGYPFLIYKEYASLDDFDASDFPEIGLMFMVKEREFGAYPVYRFTGGEEEPYSYITALSDGEAIKGDKGDAGEQGPQGAPGKDGKDATINGVNTLTIEAGDNIAIDQDGSTLTISATAGGFGGGTKIANISPNGNVIDLDISGATSPYIITSPATGWINAGCQTPGWIIITVNGAMSQRAQMTDSNPYVVMPVTKGDTITIVFNKPLASARIYEVPPVDGTLYIKNKDILYNGVVLRTGDITVEDMSDYDEIMVSVGLALDGETINFSTLALQKDGERIMFDNYYNGRILHMALSMVNDTTLNVDSYFISGSIAKGLAISVTGIKYARVDEYIPPVVKESEKLILNAVISNMGPINFAAPINANEDCRAELWCRNITDKIYKINDLALVKNENNILSYIYEGFRNFVSLDFTKDGINITNFATNFKEIFLKIFSRKNITIEEIKPSVSLITNDVLFNKKITATGNQGPIDINGYDEIICTQQVESDNGRIYSTLTTIYDAEETNAVSLDYGNTRVGLINFELSGGKVNVLSFRNDNFASVGLKIIGRKFASNIYREEETRIGTWIDGKPIYRRIIRHPGAMPTGNSEIPIDVSIETLLKLYGTYKNDYNFGVYPGSHPMNSAYITSYIDMYRKVIKIYIDPQFNNITDSTFVIEYTKAQT